MYIYTYVYIFHNIIFLTKYLYFHYKHWYKKHIPYQRYVLCWCNFLTTWSILECAQFFNNILHRDGATACDCICCQWKSLLVLLLVENRKPHYWLSRFSLCYFFKPFNNTYQLSYTSSILQDTHQKWVFFGTSGICAAEKTLNYTFVQNRCL